MSRRLEVVGQILTCTACELHADCTAPVPLAGPTPARVAVIGGTPDAAADKSGEPFAASAGHIIGELLAEHGITDVAYLHTVSCWAPFGTTAEQITACAGNKHAQLELINPTVVVLVGSLARNTTRPDIQRWRRRPFFHDGRVHIGTLHPTTTYEDRNAITALRRDMDTVAKALDTDWRNLIPDTCAACKVPAVWWEANSGLGWCLTHLPEAEAILCRARHDFLAREFSKAKTASEQWQAEMANARTARDEAITRVDQNADDAWKTEAFAALRWCATQYEDFTADEVWTRLDAVGIASTHEPAALGPQFLRAARERLIEKTSRTRPTHYARRHRDLTVWRSRLYQGEVA